MWIPLPKQLKTQNLTLKSATDSGDSYVCDFGSEKVTIKHFNTPPNDGTFACGAAASSTPNIPLIYAPLPSNDSSKWACEPGPQTCTDRNKDGEFGNYPCYNALVANGIIADPNSDPNSEPNSEPNSNQFDQVCNGYANIVNNISKNPAGLPKLTKSGDKWSSCYASTAGLGKLIAAGGRDPTETTNCEFQNANVIFYAQPDDGSEQAFPPCSGTSPLGPPVPYGSGLPPNDAACYNVLKNVGCITSSPEPAPAPGPAPGNLGGKCKKGKKCDKGLYCNDSICESSPGPAPGPTDQGLSTPAVVGISVGGAVLLIGIIFGIAHLAKKKKKGRK